MDHTESAKGHRGSTKGDEDDHRANQRSPRHKPVESAVRPTLLPEGRTVFVNSLRQVQYSHVETGIFCFQVAENFEVLNTLFFKGVPAASDQVDRKRKARRSTRVAKRQVRTLRRSSAQLAVHEKHHKPCWSDPLCLRNDRRRPTKTTTPENRPSKDSELKQAALWHRDRQYISQANDASVEGITSFLRWSRSRFKPRKLENLSQSSEFATELLSSPAGMCLSSPSHQAQVELCEGVYWSASDPAMCG